MGEGEGGFKSGGAGGIGPGAHCYGEVGGG
jgi:hypothetical protein